MVKRIPSETCPYPDRLCGFHLECLECGNEDVHSSRTVDLTDIKVFFSEAFPNGIQMFNTHNTSGDYMTEIYSTDGVCVLFAPGFNYIEVFGLTPEQFDELNQEFGNSPFRSKGE